MVAVRRSGSARPSGGRAPASTTRSRTGSSGPARPGDHPLRSPSLTRTRRDGGLFAPDQLFSHHDHGLRDPGGYGAGRDAQDPGDLVAGVAVKVVEDDRRAHLWAELVEAALEQRLRLDPLVAAAAGTHPGLGRDDPRELLAAQVGDGHVHGDPVQPGAWRAGGPVLVTRPEGSHEALLAEVLRERAVEDHRPDGSVDRAILALVELPELGRRVQLGGLLHGPPIVCSLSVAIAQVKPKECYTGHLEEVVELATVGETMSTQLVTMAQGSSLAEAASVMSQRRVGSVLIMDGERLAGILTERDIVRAISLDIGAPRDEIGHWMTESPQTIDVSGSLETARAAMDRAHTR